MNKFEVIEVEKSDGYAILYLNRPKQLNALNYKIAEELYLSLSEISKNNSIRCLIISGKGNAFCVGGDLIEFERAEQPKKFISKLANKLHEGIKVLKNLNAPSIAAVNGACFGAGLSLACACDLRICSENAKFGSAFTNVGLSPDTSLTYHLPKIVGLSLSYEMVFLNRIFNSEEAKKVNLVSQISSDDSLLSEVKKLAIKLSHGPTLALGSAKRLLIKSYSNDLELQLGEEVKNITRNAGTEDFQEGVKAFLEKRTPNFKGK